VKKNTTAHQRKDNADNRRRFNLLAAVERFTHLKKDPLASIIIEEAWESNCNFMN